MWKGYFMLHIKCFDTIHCQSINIWFTRNSFTNSYFSPCFIIDRSIFIEYCVGAGYGNPSKYFIHYGSW